MELRSVSFAYDNESKKALNNISLKIYEGERVVILGHNGSGKSTLAKIMGALQDPLQGVCLVRGQDVRDIKELRELIGMVFQNPDNQIVASMIEDDVAFAPENQGLDWQIIQERVDNAIKITGLENKRGAMTSEMSGGEKQRMALAGAVAANVKCLILDEPTAMLDPEGRVQVENVIKSLHKSGVTIIQITHQLEFFDDKNNLDADRVLVLSHGELIWEGTPEEFAPLAESMGFEKFERPINLEELKKILANKNAARAESMGFEKFERPISLEELKNILANNNAAQTEGTGFEKFEKPISLEELKKFLANNNAPRAKSMGFEKSDRPINLEELKNILANNNAAWAEGMGFEKFERPISLEELKNILANNNAARAESMGFEKFDRPINLEELKNILACNNAAWAEGMGFEKFDRPISLEELKNILANKNAERENFKNLKNFIEIKNLYFRFASLDKNKNILENINLEIKRGAWLSITGRTGSGKSTLVQHLNALYKIQAGKILIDNNDLPQSGDDVKDLRRRVGLVFQNPEDQLFCPTVREELEFAPRNADFNLDKLKQAVLNAIKLVGLDESFLERSPLALSGGEKRLVAIASVLSAEPECIILDEPLAGLDAYYKNKILNMLRDLKNQGRSIVVITHDINSALKFSDEIIILEQGKSYNSNLNINLNINKNSELAALSGFAGFNILGQYVPSGSIIHKLDPRAKLIAVLFLVSAVISSAGFAQLAVCLAGLLGLVKLAKISVKNIISSSRPIFFLAAFTFIFNLIALSLGDDISLGAAAVQGAFLAARLLMLMFYAVLLPLTTTPLELSDGIGELLKPLAKFKFPAQECAVMIGMALRFIPLLMQETDKITRAQLSRGARLDQGGIFKRLKAFFPVLIPLFIIIFRRADDMALAMEARGYNIGRKRTRRKPLHWTVKDTLAVLLSVAIAIIFLI
ncbi:MAG: ATP-binding cassette domain-containing protein, partial [Synergistaceae bacterium]|nr:ATP-binding cassette domain-containing protein [Synergistaceae bacterium]